MNSSAVVPDSAEHISTNTNTTNFFPYEQVTAYGLLYVMALLSILIGSVRSLHFVQNRIKKKKLLEVSISMHSAKKFPITASCVLFGLYLFFKCDADRRSQIFDYFNEYVLMKLPTQYQRLLSFNNVTDSWGDVHGSMNSTSILKRTLSFLPEINKVNAMNFLLILVCWEGSIALAAILKPLFTFILCLLPIGQTSPRLNIPYLCVIKKGLKEMNEGDIEDAKTKDTEVLFQIEWDTHDMVAILFCSVAGVWHVYNRHWITNDLLGIALSIYAIETLHLSNFKAGVVLLAGLFVYDVFWVFGTDVMTTVAKSIDAPILLQMPQDIYRNGWRDATKHAMLGLGDIVIPGIFIALLRRFDHRIGADSKIPLKGQYYFLGTIFAYTVGLCVTMLVMHAFKAAQPALLYLVPTCVFFPLCIAKARGELSQLWNYSEDHLVEKSANDLEKGKKTK